MRWDGISVGDEWMGKGRKRRGSAQQAAGVERKESAQVRLMLPQSLCVRLSHRVTHSLVSQSHRNVASHSGLLFSCFLVSVVVCLTETARTWMVE